MAGVIGGPLGDDDDGNGDRSVPDSVEQSTGQPGAAESHVIDPCGWGDEYGTLRPRRGTRMHRAFASARRDSAARSLTIAGAKSLDIVQLGHGGDVYSYLVKGGSRLTGSGETGRIADFQPTSDDAKSCAGDANDIGGDAQDLGGDVKGSGEDSALHAKIRGRESYRSLTDSLSPYDLSCRMREAAHAKSRLHAVETVATAETALASVGVHGEDPAAIDDILVSHDAYTARERIAGSMPAQLIHALVVDFDLTHNQARRRAIDAVISYIALSGSLRDVFDGVLSSEKLMVLVRRSGALSLADMRWLDLSSCELDPDLPLEAFARRISELVATRANRRQKAKNAFATRRVEFERFDNGSGCVSLYGPLTVLEPLMKRVRATAEAILAGRISPLDVTDIDGCPVSLAGLKIVDTRSLDQLMFDLLALVAPGTRVAVEESDDPSSGRGSDGGAGSHTESAGSDDRVNGSDADMAERFGEEAESLGDTYGVGGRLQPDHGWVRPTHMSAHLSDTANDGIREFVIVRCPTEGDWLAEQARVSITVPVLTCIDADGLLPGEMEGHSPIPADLVRTILPTQSVVYRLLTDPVSGEVLEEVATTYRVSAGMRRTVEARHRSCAAPGCKRSSTKLDMDHIVPFKHADPLNGGLTVVDNLHPLCEYHHQLKTAGIITVVLDDDGTERWNYPLGREAIAMVDSNIAEVEAAQQLLELLIDEANPAEAAVTCSDVECDHKATAPDDGYEEGFDDRFEEGFDDGAPPF